MKKLLSTLALGLVGLLGAAQAAPQLSPQGIIVNPIPTDLEVRTWVNKDPNKTGNPVYQIGERIQIGVSVNQDAYVYLFSVRATGEISPILPNNLEQNNFLRAGETRLFPGQGARYQFTVDGPEGQDRVLAVATRTALNVNQIIDIQTGRSRVQGADNLARALSIVVTPLPDNDWVSNVAFFIVGRAVVTPPPAPTTGTLQVNSNPQGAQVLVNGRVVGQTPLNLSLNVGRYDLEMRLGGYAPFRQSVQINGGQVTPINVGLQALRSTLQVFTNVPARIFVDGQEVGQTQNGVLQINDVNPGRVQVVAIAPGYRVEFRDVNLSVGRAEQVRLNLNRAR
jgi:hypothetical protein